MNKKGFTLTELLAVIVIISLLSLITSTAIISSIKKSKEKLYDIQIQNILVAGESFVEENKADVLNLIVENNASCAYVSLTTLQNRNYIDKEIKNPLNTKETIQNKNVKVSVNLNNNVTFNYEIIDDTSNCIEYEG